MSRFFRERGPALAIVIVVSAVISLSQGGISYSVLRGALRDRFNVDAPLLASLHWLIRAGLLVLAGTLWTLRRKRAVFRVIIVANAFFTAILLSDVAFLLSVLSGSKSRAAATLLADVALIAVSNILISSIWYWIIEPPGVIEGEDAHQPGHSSFRSGAASCRATNRGCPVTWTIYSLRSRPALRSARRTRYR